ncbi:hypothetical protein CTA2_11559 [Colletotrichum tanaceti]|uniref:Uncharacterized protein n=1 Tax=Colletotrichum tanaceti TaxID=1306861 RepID=A0A4V6DGD5_9PEZI|nr:hypothetical protein CTA2_11559 [Colletotrichum tanaceti]TKW52426.1 hypothetical protein CTA1_2325 [Colletotrichum tanaceti]
MLLITLKHLFLLLISLFILTRAEREILGYRRVSREEAVEINRRNNIFRESSYDRLAYDKAEAQIGNGVYLSFTIYSYEKNSDYWWCYVKADRGKLRRAPKVWIPESLWGHPESQIASYVRRHLHQGESADSALRLSRMKSYPNGYDQVLIPTSMVQNDELDTFAKCYEEDSDVPVKEDVDYDEWTNFRNSQ